MKNYMLLLALLFTFQFTKAQSECVKVETTLQKYMEGSSYNKLDLLESAFTEDATLYLTLRDGSFKSITPKDYVGFFKIGINYCFISEGPCSYLERIKLID